jgi:UDP:flavonoid glycosyltransferase YjiC (YdhE family)
MIPRHILFACELGNGLRQADRIRPFAQGLIAAGHRVSVALPDGAPAASLLELAGLPTLTAPAWRAEAPPGFLASNFSDILLLSGYFTTESLGDLARGWLDLFRDAAPDLVVADFAPSAMLAARVAGLRLAAMGDGYGLPPLTNPLPSMRPWAEVTTAQRADSDARALAVVNPVLRELGAAPLRRIGDLFNAGARWLCAFPELDHYENRGDADYFGEVPPPPTGLGVAWPEGTAERALVVMDSRHRPFRPLLAALRRLGLPSVVQAWGMTPALAAELSGPGMVVVTEPLNRDTMLANCDIVVCQSAGVVAPALLANRPVLLLPNPVEQMMTLHRVARQGLGHGLAPDTDQDAAQAGLRRLLDDRGCRLRVANFARAYQGYSTAIAIDAMIEDCLAILADS